MQVQRDFMSSRTVPIDANDAPLEVLWTEQGVEASCSSLERLSQRCSSCKHSLDHLPSGGRRTVREGWLSEGIRTLEYATLLDMKLHLRKTELLRFGVSLLKTPEDA
jgi:hypothetical protein